MLNSASWQNGQKSKICPKAHNGRPQSLPPTWSGEGRGPHCPHTENENPVQRLTRARVVTVFEVEGGVWSPAPNQRLVFGTGILSGNVLLVMARSVDPVYLVKLNVHMKLSMINKRQKRQCKVLWILSHVTVAGQSAITHISWVWFSVSLC